MMEFDLKGGVLIVGSLFWQNDLDPRKKDGLRKKWRNEHLSMDETVSVSVPTKYGRFSGNSKNEDQTYTMVFDNSLARNQFGQGKAIPFKINPMNWNQLRNEIESLSNAEGNGDETFIKGNAAWCVCGIVFSSHIDSNIKSGILKQWGIALMENQIGYEVFQQNPSLYSVSNQGELQIPFPEEKEAKGFDYLVATTTKPKSREGIAVITLDEVIRYIQNRPYFISNFLNGIGTFQDRGIISKASKDKDLLRFFFKSVVEHYHTKTRTDNNHRFTSWDHCFQSFHSDDSNEQKALHLGTYLASWGMYRGSGGLLQKDYKIHIDVIEIINKEKYSDLSATIFDDIISLVFELIQEISNYYSSITYERMGSYYKISPTDTLITKILLGTVACVPAFDQFFKEGLKMNGITPTSFNSKRMKGLFEWIQENDIHKAVLSLDEDIEGLPIMKLLDMYFWTLGYCISIIEKKRK